MEPKVFARFKDKFPNHPLPYSKGLEWWYERMLGREERKYNYKIPPTEEEWAKYEEWRLGRVVDRLALFPLDALKVLLPVIDELLAIGIQNADLAGSFSRGEYCLNEIDLAVKSKVKRAKISDVDVVIYDDKYPNPTKCDVLNNNCTYPSVIPIIRNGEVV